MGGRPHEEGRACGTLSHCEVRAQAGVVRVGALSGVYQSLFTPPWAPLVHYLLVLSLLYIISESVLLRPLRLQLVSHAPKVLLPWVVGLLYCPRCMGFWLGGAVGYFMWGSAPLAFILALFSVAQMKLTYSFITFELDPWVTRTEEEEASP